MRCVLGVDSGGTKSDVLLVRDDGIVLGHGYVDYRDPASGRDTLGSGRSLQSVTQAIQQALGHTTCDELYYSSVCHTHPPDIVPSDCAREIKFERIYETDPAFALAGVDAGIVVLAGTGALVHGRTRDGRHVRMDGVGPYLGDFGSGFHIGQLALRAVARSVMHPRHATMLPPMIYEQLNLAEKKYPFGNLLEYMLKAHDRAEIAGFARLVNTAAEAGDQVAINILHEAAASIAETVFDAVDRLQIAEEDYPLVASGSVATHSRIYWEHLSELVHGFAPRLTPIRPELPSVVGLALLTLRKLAVPDPDAMQRNLFRTAREALGMQN